MRFPALVLMGGLMLLIGCRSRYVEATVRNGSGAAVSVVEVDYPSASFGKETLAAGADYHYRFKVQGDGPLKVLWTDAGNKDHTVGGPQLREGSEGTLAVTIKANDAAWDLQVQR